MPKEQDDKQQVGPVMPDLPFVDAEDDAAKAAAEAEAVKKSAEEGLLSQVEELKRQIAAMEQTNIALMGRPVAQPVAPPPARPDLSNLPNPIDDADAFAEAIVERTQKHDQQLREFEAAQREVEMTNEGRLQALWSDFQINYGEQADQGEDRVKFAAQKVIQRAVVKGIDPERYIFGHSDRFQKDVAAEVDAIFGAKKAPAAQQQEVNRTGGAFGGMESGGRPVPPAEAGADADMFADIRKFREKTGLY